ncbi:endonuclease [Flavobacterium dankookense]|uniref:Putative secreted protein (Por secretion system target) n=1 Tax=Flavobacterium dankookense TaxID=706186 RepID=A0A4R6QBB5_9FLAO|nr:endonuclease [Flavobacterium dankookense]TDP59500.1 putative secreted protein (Por secretion system target) [Flavobacterium dankookense]
MLKNTIFLVAMLATFFCQSQIFINELDSDTPSVDDKEFIELKSITPNFPLDGYVLVLFNGTGSQANLSYYVIDLDGFVTDVNGLFLIGNSFVSPVPEKLLPESIFQNGSDGVGLYLGSSSDFPNNSLATITNLIDAIVYGTNDPDATELMALLGVTIQLDESASGASTANSIQRKNDGTYEAKTPTPGANNDGSGFIFNGITISTSAFQVTEGNNLQITFTAQTPVVSDVLFTFSLSSGSLENADFTGSTNVIIPSGTTTFSTTITFVDDVLDEGDEVAIIKFGLLPSGFIRLNDFIEIRVVDNDFTQATFGTPLNPTYDFVESTSPNGYYSSLEGLAGDALKQELQNIIANPAVVRAHNYGDIVDILKVADQNPLNSNEVWLMYVEIPRSKLDYQTGSIGTGKWNREHIYPQSRGGFANATEETPDGINVWLPTSADDIAAGHADAHHLRAEDGPENTNRSNKDYGLTGYNGRNGNQSSWKGDVARAIFYMAVRYNGLEVVNGDLPDTTVGQIGDLATLLQWNQTDPSDDFEMNRNNYIYTWQYNRNPFIDYPNLADYIWGNNAGQAWSSSLSTNQNNIDKIALHPNPSNGNFTISGVKSDAVVTIYNMLGAEVFKTSFDGTSEIETNLTSGIYLAKITSEGNSVSRKIIIK